MRRDKRKKQDEFKRRYDAVKNLMSTFAMSTVAVVAAVTLIAASPKALIMKAVAMSEEVAYQVNVTDEDNALDLDTLVIVLENQLEYYEHPLSLGENSGFFENLNYNTEYRLSVYGSKGFGQERLDTVVITTRAKIGGTILSVTKDGEDFHSEYVVDVSIHDPDDKYSSITLYYGYSHYPDEEIIYSSISVNNDRESIIIPDLFTEERFHIYLEGVTTDSTELLDDIWVTPPYQFYGSIHIKEYGFDSFTFHTYEDETVEEVEYHIKVLKAEEIIINEKATLIESSNEGYDFKIDGLQENTTYFIEITARYKNPQTLVMEEMVIYYNELTTLNHFSYTYNIDYQDDYIEVTVTLNDPGDHFQYVYYDIYEIIDGHGTYNTSSVYYFTTVDDTKSVVFMISYPTFNNYEIDIGMRNQTDYFIQVHIVTIESP